MSHPIGIRSLGVSFPSIIRTNNPDLIAQTPPRRARLSHSHELDIWSQEVAPYLSDPFRGNVERRVLGPDESSLMLEYQAAQDALDAAKLSPEEIDLAIVASLFPEQIIHGNAVDLARELKLLCPAWNLESTCSSALIALQNACALIQAGIYRRILVITSHIGSNSVDEEDTLSRSMGDAAGAFVVDSLKANQGILGMKIINTAVTAGAYLHELVTDDQGKPRMSTRTGENASMLAETAVDFVRTCCKEAVASAGVTLDKIDFFGFNTPTPWYANVCTRALGINPERTINLYPRYANIGPVFPIANLYHAALAGQIRENDLVLIYTNGAGATAGAMVMRWGDVAIGSVPTAPISVTPEQEKVYLDTQASVRPISISKEGFSQIELLAVQAEKRRQILETYLMQILSELLKLPSSKINNQQSFTYLIDSLIALELRRRIDSDLELLVPMEKFFKNSSIAKMADLLMEKLAIASLNIPQSLSPEIGENIEEITL
ncbi:3-oxoacyl-ACP synthase [Nostoc sp. CCCryo 231-06]|nr:3-oxoacyl-ACP synthase [Nostoc sp. CCCryo 231-06]